MKLTEEQVERLVDALSGTIIDNATQSEDGYVLPLGRTMRAAADLLVEIGDWELMEPESVWYRPKPTPAKAGEEVT